MEIESVVEGTGTLVEEEEVAVDSASVRGRKMLSREERKGGWLI